MPHNLAKFGRNVNFRTVPNVTGDSIQLKNASKQFISIDENESVGTTSVLYDEMVIHWDLIEDLWSGTRRMRAAGLKWLPKEPKEEDDIYKNRLDRSILFNAFRAAIDRLVSKPFSQAVTVSEISGDGRLNSIKDDVDGTGKNITQLGREVFESGLKYGLTHILVDFTRVPSDLETKEDEDAIQPRPFFVHITPPQLIFWDLEEDPITRIPTLTEIRIKEVSVNKVGRYSDEVVERIRIFRKDTWEVWELSKEEGKHTYRSIEEGVHSFGAVPLITFYVRRTGPLTGTPPFEDLAWLNLAHWQSDSDQRNILRFARTGVLFGSGWNEDEVNDASWGPTSFFKTTNHEGDLKTVEYKGTGIKAGAEDLKALEQRMELMGLQPLIERTANSTATGKVLDETKTINDIQAWIRALENTLNNAYEAGAQWLNQNAPKDLTIDIFSDFEISMQGTKDLQTLIQMQKDDIITTETLLREVKRRGVLSDSFEVDEEIKSIARRDDLENNTDDIVDD